MSDSSQSSASGFGKASVLFVIIAVLFRTAPVAVQSVEKPVVESSAQQRPASDQDSLSVAARVRRYAQGRRLLAEYLNRPWESLAERAPARKIAVRIIIATLADPFDSYLDWSYDANIESLRRAFGAAGYVPQSYWMPDRRDSVMVRDGIIAGRYSRHTLHPGVFLFRSTKPDSISLALLYVVPELPSRGLRRRAFEAALSDRASILSQSGEWFEFDNRERTQLSVLGPTFSGSSSSLRLMLNALTANPESQACAARIVSGSATSFSNQRVLTDSATRYALTSGGCVIARADSGGGEDAAVSHLSFAATVNADEAMDQSLATLLGKLGVKANQVAILSESGTQYGAMRAENGARDSIAGQPNSAVTDTTSQPKVSAPLDKYLTVTFPMNIGSLRAEYARATGTTQPAAMPQLGAAPRTRVALEDNERPTEFPPALSRLTVPTSDVVLSAAMRELQEHDIRVVVVRATDVRDKLMLVRELRRNLRNVTVVLYESNALLRHPEFSSLMRGSLVLSSYPMLLENQFWTSSARGSDGRAHTSLQNLTSFPNDASIGVYNAALTLLDAPHLRIEYDLTGSSRVGNSGEVPFRYAQPPVWLSVIGSNGFYPLRADTVVDAAVDSHQNAFKRYMAPGVAAPQAVDTVDNVHEHTFGTRGLAQSAMLILPALLLTIAMVVMSFGNLLPDRWRARIPATFGPPANGRQRFFLAQFGVSLSVSYLPLAVAVDARRTIETMQVLPSSLSAEVWFVVALLAINVIVSLFGAILVRHSIVEDIRTSGQVPASYEANVPLNRNTQTDLEARAERNGFEKRIGIGAGLSLVGLACALFAAGSIGYTLHLTNILHRNGIEAAITWYRTLHLTSGVSPITPLVLLGIAFAAWTWWQLQQSRIFDNANPLEIALARLAKPGSAAIWSRSHRAIVQARRALTWFAPSPLVFLIGLCLLVATWFVLRGLAPTLERVASTDGSNWSFDLALWIGILSLVTASAWAIYRLLHAWNGVERFLDIVAGTPVASAFGRLPLDIARLTDVGFLGRRRDSSSDHDYLEQLWDRAICDVEGAGRIQEEIDVAKAKHAQQAAPQAKPRTVAVGADGALIVGAQPSAAPPTAESIILKGVNTKISELMAAAKWSRPSSVRSVEAALLIVKEAWDVARTRPDPFKELPIEEPKIAMPNARALRTIEEYIAFEVLLYTEMYLLNMRRLCFFLFASLLILVIISSQYPYEPHSVVSIATIILLLTTVASIFFVVVRMSRSSTLSRIAHTEPGKVTWDASFVLKLLTFCVLPIMTLVSAEFPEIRSLLFSWLSPITRAMGQF
ncbi:MAG: hypothetical protein ACO1Q7_12420 [Gemmatimonas sp.]